MDFDRGWQGYFSMDYLDGLGSPWRGQVSQVTLLVLDMFPRWAMGQGWKLFSPGNNQDIGACGAKREIVSSRPCVRTRGVYV